MNTTIVRNVLRRTVSQVSNRTSFMSAALVARTTGVRAATGRQQPALAARPFGNVLSIRPQENSSLSVAPSRNHGLGGLAAPANRGPRPAGGVAAVNTAPQTRTIDGEEENQQQENVVPAPAARAPRPRTNRVAAQEEGNNLRQAMWQGPLTSEQTVRDERALVDIQNQPMVPSSRTPPPPPAMAAAELEDDSDKENIDPMPRAAGPDVDNVVAIVADAPPAPVAPPLRRSDRLARKARVDYKLY